MAPKSINSKVILPRQNTLSTKLTLPWLIPIKNCVEDRSLAEKSQSTSDIRTVCQMITHQDKKGSWNNHRQQRSVVSTDMMREFTGKKEMKRKQVSMAQSSLPKIIRRPNSRDVLFSISEKKYLELPRLRPGVKEAILKCLHVKSPNAQFKRRIESKKGIKYHEGNADSESQFESSVIFKNRS
jgi:hypothetical protein